MKLRYLMIISAIIVTTSTACNNNTTSKEAGDTPTEPVTEKILYRAELHSLNTAITGMKTQGEAIFVVDGDELRVSIDITDAPPSIQHWQHFHGFEDGSDAGCATIDQDNNLDGIIDVVETEEVSGTTMVPFNKIPAQMALAEDSYPIAAEDGSYSYHSIIKLADLEETFAEAFNGGNIDLDKRVFYVHGVPEDSNLPESVQSVHGIPSHITLPIACGKIVKIEN